jgi:hypothetical protein
MQDNVKYLKIPSIAKLQGQEPTKVFVIYITMYISLQNLLVYKDF